MHKITLLFGSNLGNSKKYIQDAIAEFSLYTKPDISKSSLYMSDSWGFKSKNKFINQVVIMETEYGPFEILHIIQTIELKLGRMRNAKSYTDRTIDIDILFYDNDIIETKELIVPHPRMACRKFALVPLAELIPEYVHPVFKKNIRELLLECPDDSEILKLQ